jgi:hypothetical protein
MGRLRAVYLSPMKVSINPRDNGACPLCERAEGCRIRVGIRDTLAAMRPEGGHPVEVVIYSCPQFKEKP